MRRRLTRGVVAFVLFLSLNTFDIKRSNLLGSFFFYLSLQVNKAAIGIELLFKFRQWHLKQLRKLT